MGEVYRATDTNLKRQVAIKVLPASVAADADRLARFQREAEVLAALNHPNIAHIHGLEKSDGTLALVMELVEGPTLADRIAKGAIPIDESLLLAQQIAEALEAAHEQGIIHRDLKPANIKVRPDGTVKVLDFGLAKAMDPVGSRPDVSQSPTLTSPAMTAAGVILGTAAYMSPEQARGQVVDKRSDIWAFGCVLFEMLTATRAFQGEYVSDVVASVLRGAPDWSALPPAATPLTGMLQRCLEKDVKRRLRDIGDVKLLIEDAVMRTPAVTAAPVLASSRAGRTAIAAVLGVIVGGTGMAFLARSRLDTIPAGVGRFELTASPADPLAAQTYGVNVAISPDGSRIVYTSTRGGVPELVMRRLDQLEAKPIPGAEGGFDPFFSPDGQEVGFATFTQLKRVAAAGGPSVTICPVDAFFSGASWGSNNTIVFAQASLGLFRIPASGGQPERLASPDTTKGELAYVRPVMLRGGQAVLYTVVLSDSSKRIVARRLGGGDLTTVVEGGFGPQYLPSGHLVYGQADRLMAVRFDEATLHAAGSPVSVQEGVFSKVADGVANVVFARDGTGVYVAGDNTAGFRRLAWVDPHGTHITPAIEQPLEYPRNLRLSPDGRRVALTVGPPGQGQIWVHDLGGAVQPVKLTFQDHNIFPVWSPDGKQIAFLSRAGSASRLLSIPADGSIFKPERLTTSEVSGVPLAWSPDGASLLFGEPQPPKIWLLHVRDGKIIPWQQTPFAELGGSLSADGRWVAYVSNQTGAAEVWVRPFPGPGAAVRVSSGGGVKPVWSRDGKTIFYENGPKLLSAGVVSQTPDFRVDVPHMLFEGGFVHDDADPVIRFLDVAPDGRFLIVGAVDTGGAATVVIAQHWDEELKRLLPAK
jgi:eukaryotic-like serine/threonine-protein kinase